jgi:hypothetical protein
LKNVILSNGFITTRNFPTQLADEDSTSHTAPPALLSCKDRHRLRLLGCSDRITGGALMPCGPAGHADGGVASGTLEARILAQAGKCGLVKLDEGTAAYEL